MFTWNRKSRRIIFANLHSAPPAAARASTDTQGARINEVLNLPNSSAKHITSAQIIFTLKNLTCLLSFETSKIVGCGRSLRKSKIPELA
jgi:hypothetical protein